MTQTPHEARRERAARIIDPSSWRVLDSYLAEVKRKYAGQDAAYDPDAFKDKASLAKADAILADDPALVLVEALAKRAYLMSEPHLSGHRVVLGFETADDAMAAHTALAAYQSTDKGDAE